MKDTKKLNLIQGLSKTFNRFPIALMISVCAWVTIILLIEKTFAITNNQRQQTDYVYEYLLIRMFLALVMTYFISTASKLAAEVYKLNKTSQFVLNIFTIIVPIAYFKLVWPVTNDLVVNSHIQNYAILMLIITAVNLTIPYWNKDQNHQQWQFLFETLIAATTSILISAVIMLCFVIFMIGINTLFNLNMQIDLYIIRVFATLGTLFTVNLFLYNLPKKFDKTPNNSKQDLNILKIISNYILLPFVFGYFAIMYAYIFNILITAQWPEGSVVYTILALIVPVFIYTLVAFPFKNQFKNKSLKILVNKGLFALLIPVICVYFYAIYIRIAEFGITIDRYFVVIFGIWVTLNSIYYLVTKKQKFGSMFYAAIILGVITNFGPLNAWKVSEISQTNRLLNIFNTTGLLVNGKLVDSATISNDVFYDIYSINYYLQDNHELKYFNKVIPQVVKNELENKDLFSTRINYAITNPQNIEINVPKQQLFDISKYQQMAIVDSYYTEEAENEFKAKFDYTKQQIILQYPNQTKVVIPINLNSDRESLRQASKDNTPYIITTVVNDVEYTLHIETLFAQIIEKSINVTRLEGYLFF